MKTLKIIILCFITLIYIDCEAQQRPQFDIIQQGREYKEPKPTLTNRLNGSSGFVIIHPEWMRSQKDKYIFNNLKNILRDIGATNVYTVSANFEVNSPRTGIAQYFIQSDVFIDDLTNYTTNIVILPQLTSIFPDEEHLYLDFYDLSNDWNWRVDFYVPKKYDKYLNKFKQVVSSEIKYSSVENDKYSTRYYMATWDNLDWYKNDVKFNDSNIYEGLYENEIYQCFLKYYNEKLYLINLRKTQLSIWKGKGEVKAILTPTAVQDVFICDYFDEFGSCHKCKVFFDNGYFNIHMDDADEILFLKTWPLNQQPKNY